MIRHLPDRSGITYAFFRFAIVGIAGFIVDALILTALVRLGNWIPWLARLPSFAAAVLVTWVMNRSFTFGARTVRPRTTRVDALGYFAIQSIGALINLTLFVELLPHLANWPLPVTLAIAASAGLAFNFVAANFWLYAKRDS